MKTTFSSSLSTVRIKSSIVILTGAGISAESGIKTFRDQNGLWENHRVEDVASLDGYLRNPLLVQNFYNLRRAQLMEPSIQPNAAHLALVELERSWSGKFLLVTQNVDNLHERAGSQNVLHMHGELLKVRCERTERVFEWKDPVEDESVCPCCQQRGTLRPHIVWFGEMPLLMEEITEALEECDFFVSIGTSGQVYPAAGFVERVKPGARTIEVNLESSMISDRFGEHRLGPASQCVPRLIHELALMADDIESSD